MKVLASICGGYLQGIEATVSADSQWLSHSKCQKTFDLRLVNADGQADTQTYGFLLSAIAGSNLPEKCR